MPSLFQQIKAGQLWDFHGGIHPPARKKLTSQAPIGQMALPERLYVPLRQHIGVAGKLLVKAGDLVLKGQPLTAADNAMAIPVHAPTSGQILAIENYPSAHPSALPEPCLVLQPDGLEQWRPRHALDYLHTERPMLLARIQQAGIAGMGGAGFPTHIKSGASTGVDYLIINAVECEPYITADDVLMQHHAATIVRGIEILCKLLNPKAVLIGIEDDKPQAIAAMQLACQGKADYLLRVVPAKYPSGGEKQLIKLLTSKEVPNGRRPLDIGIVMQNVGTVFAIAQAIEEDIPLISRIVTVVGQTLQHSQNIRALIGTPVGALLDACGFAAEPQQRVIMGGPMMGFTLPTLQIPLVKTTNCIIAPTKHELPAAGDEMDCIRCGACAEVCPAVLLPQQLVWYAKAKDYDQLKAHNLADCIECGACSYVCPSEIPLVQYYRIAKAEIRELAREELKAEQAKARFEARNERLERDKQQRAERNQALAAQRQAMLAEQQKQQIAAAQQRVDTAAPQELSKEQIIAERERKKAEARAYQAAKAQPADETTSSAAPDSAVTAADSAADPRAAAVAAAIARAKAKKSADAAPAPQADSAPHDSAAPDSPVPGTAEDTAEVTATDDPRKAAVAAAIARAKAKKLAEAAPAVQPEDVPSTAEATASVAEDPRKAAVAAAIARAKAKKLAEAAPEADPEDTPITAEPAASTAEDPRKAAVAAAIARAKAKKLAEASAVEAAETTQAADVPTETQDVVTSSAEAAPAVPAEDAKKAAIAAAIARAKARQQAKPTDPEQPS
ncbi:electron transport complex subunit RsxC [Rheinheimera sp.]|uniref:electron transport complex subunit RsxC n=1 Tax=Rheinheimera sp. TaxID=1869214 RepID=UPI003D2D80E1